MERYRQETALYGVHLQAQVNFTVGQLKTLQKGGLLLDSELEQIQTLLQNRVHKKAVTEETNADTEEEQTQEEWVEEIPTDEPSAE